MSTNPPRKHLVLLGTGPAHLQVLQGLSNRTPMGLAVTLVAPSPYYIPGNMLSGFVGGQYLTEEICQPIDELVQASAAQFVPAHVVSLDPSGRRVQLSTGDALSYDLLSIDGEPEVDRTTLDQTLPGARSNALLTHPHEAFLQLWPQMRALANERALQIAVVADGLVGLELAMVMADTLAQPHGSRVTLVLQGPVLENIESQKLQRRISNRLHALEITVLPEPCQAIDPQAVVLSSGARLSCDAPVVALGGGLPGWLVSSGIECNELKLPILNERLQVESHKQIFVIPPEAPVEVGPALYTNLCTALEGGNFKKASLGRGHLPSLTSGEGRAMAVWGPLALEGREVWHWKQRNDRRQLAALMKR